MDFEFSEEHSMFRQAIRDFAENEVAPIVDQAEENETCPTELFSKMGKLGYLCPGYPTEYGGGGLGEIGTCIMVEELAPSLLWYHVWADGSIWAFYAPYLGSWKRGAKAEVCRSRPLRERRSLPMALLNLMPVRMPRLLRLLLRGMATNIY